MKLAKCDTLYRITGGNFLRTYANKETAKIFMKADGWEFNPVKEGIFVKDGTHLAGREIPAPSII